MIEKYPNINKDFEGDTSCLCYDNRFECLICKLFVCRECVYNMYGVEICKKGKEEQNEWAEYMNRPIDEIEEYKGIMGEDGPIICPICKTKDYMEYNGNK
jgi:hypothetical protein